MSIEHDVDALIDQFHRAQTAFVRGDAEPCKRLFSQRDDVTLNNPLSPPARGWEQVAATMERAAAPMREGEMTGPELVHKQVAPDFAYLVEVERGTAKVGGSDELTPWSLRVTMIFRPEDGEWKIVHRHADPITTARAAESIIET